MKNAFSCQDIYYNSLYFIKYQMPTIGRCAIIWYITKREKSLLIKLEHGACAEFLLYADWKTAFYYLSFLYKNKKGSIKYIGLRYSHDFFLLKICLFWITLKNKFYWDTSYAIIFHPFKVYNSVSFFNSYSVESSLLSNFRTFHYAQKKPHSNYHSSSISPSSTSSSWLPRIYFVCLHFTYPGHFL